MERTRIRPRVQVEATPLLGFGIIGWTGLIVLAILVGVALSGANPVLEIQRIWMSFFGFESMGRASSLAVNYWSLGDAPVYGFAGFAVVLVGMCVHPKRVSLVWVGVFLAWAFILPLLVPMSVKKLLLPGWASMPFLPWGSELHGFTVILLAAWTRSWVVLAGAAFLSAAALTAVNLWPMAPAWALTLLGVGYNAGLLAIILWWSIRARQRWLPVGHCYACGYDLRALAGGTCPECGREVTPEGRPPSVIARLVRAAWREIAVMRRVAPPRRSDGRVRSPHAVS